jgi:hypothetical protein
MFPRNSKPLLLAFVLDAMAQLSYNLVVSLYHVRMSILRYRLELYAVAICELGSFIRFERRLRICDKELHRTKHRDPLHQDAIKNVSGFLGRKYNKRTPTCSFIHNM